MHRSVARTCDQPRFLAKCTRRQRQQFGFVRLSSDLRGMSMRAGARLLADAGRTGEHGRRSSRCKLRGSGCIRFTDLAGAQTLKWASVGGAQGPTSLFGRPCAVTHRQCHVFRSPPLAGPLCIRCHPHTAPCLRRGRVLFISLGVFRALWWARSLRGSLRGPVRQVACCAGRVAPTAEVAGAGDMLLVLEQHRLPCIRHHLALQLDRARRPCAVGRC